MSKPMMVLIASIIENPAALRGCNKEGEEYKGVRDSIRDHGLINPICVRELPSSDGTVKYALVDGLQRVTAHIELGKTEIPALVTPLSEAAALQAQIIANAHRVMTRPVEYCKALIRILMNDPTMTQVDLAAQLNKSPTWIAAMMGLTKLEPTIQKLVDGGQIKLSNAFALAKLPKDEQLKLIVDAQTEGAEQFLTKCATRSKEIKAANRSGSDAKPVSFVPRLYLRKLAEVSAEAATPTIGPKLCKEVGAKTADQGFQLGVQWALHGDPVTLKVEEANWQAEQKKKKEDAATKAAKIAQERQASAEKAAADVQAAASAAGVNVKDLMANVKLAPAPATAVK